MRARDSWQVASAGGHSAVMLASGQAQNARHERCRNYTLLILPLLINPWDAGQKSDILGTLSLVTHLTGVSKLLAELVLRASRLLFVLGCE